MCIQLERKQTKEQKEISDSVLIGFIFALIAVVCFGLAIVAGFFELGVAASELNFIGQSQTAMNERRKLYHNLNTTALKQLWDFRIASQYNIAFLDVILGLAWFTTFPVVLTLAKLWKGQAELQIFVPAFATAVFLSLMNLCINAGVAEGTATIAGWSIMDKPNGGFGAYQALEIAYVTSRSASTWVSSIDMLLLSLGAACAGRMAMRTVPMFPCWYSWLSFSVAILALVSFLLSWGGNKNRLLTGFYGMLTFATIIAFVIWLLLTAVTFKKMICNDGEDDDSDDEYKTDDVAVDMPDQTRDEPPLPSSSPNEVNL